MQNICIAFFLTNDENNPSEIKMLFDLISIRLCHTAAILSLETKNALFYHAEPRLHGFDCEALRGKTKLFWSPGTIWPPCDKGEYFFLQKINN